MKIQNDGLPQSKPLETGRTQQTQHDAGALPAGRTIAGHDGDSVEISGMSARLAEANGVDHQQRASRVAELTALHARGGYHVKSTDLSRSLVSHAVQAGPGGAQ